MALLNHHYSKLSSLPVFEAVSQKIAQFQKKDPSRRVVNLGSGSPSHPIPSPALAALYESALELSRPETVQAYGPAQGYLFLREAISLHAYKGLVTPEEIFISHGAQSDLSQIQEIFSSDNKIAVPDLFHPSALECHVMAGRTRLPLKNGGYGGVVYLPCSPENDFCPDLPNRPTDLIYLCSPHNPTGTALSRSQLETWVAHARKNRAVLIFDGTYEPFIRSSDIPHSIYEIEGAREVAIEIRSFSKSANFSSLRCSYTVIPRTLVAVETHQSLPLHSLWLRRQQTKSNGTSYLAQRAAAALYTPEAQRAIREALDRYHAQTQQLRSTLQKKGWTVHGGYHAPFLWVRTPSKTDSWEFFDRLLETAGIAVVPGIGFGAQGAHYVRFSGFASPEEFAEGIARLEAL